MKRFGILGTALMVVLLSVALPAYAVKKVDMPDNFGKDEWVAGHWDEAVGYLKYITKNDVRESMLKLPATDRMDAWDAFWKGKGPNEESLVKERETKYFERIRYANDNFGTILQPGWLTPMGETWIRLGKPDIREQYPMRAGGRSIEVWNYMNPRDLYLVFLDRSGVGDYELLNYPDMIDEVYLY